MYVLCSFVTARGPGCRVSELGVSALYYLSLSFQQFLTREKVTPHRGSTTGPASPLALAALFSGRHCSRSPLGPLRYQTPSGLASSSSISASALAISALSTPYIGLQYQNPLAAQNTNRSGKLAKLAKLADCCHAVLPCSFRTLHASNGLRKRPTMSRSFRRVTRWQKGVETHAEEHWFHCLCWASTLAG